jgi:hypothetical protein
MGAIANRFSSDTDKGTSIRQSVDVRVGGEAGKRGGNDRGSEQSPIADVLQRLARVQAGNHRVVTCYLKLEPRDRSRGKYQIKLKNRVKAAVSGLPRLQLGRLLSEAVLRDLNRIQQFLRSPSNLPSTQ